MTEGLVNECVNYSCHNNPDIEYFFKEEFVDYAEQLLGKSYCFIKEDADEKEVVCAFTVANSSIKVDSIPSSRRNKINRGIPFPKRKSQYPAVLVGQLAVFDSFCGLGIGTEVLDFIKSWFISPLNKTGCRYIIVDAINNYKVLQYYQRNGFDFIFSSDEEEMSHLNPSCADYENIFRRTRLMYFDLITLNSIG